MKTFSQDDDVEVVTGTIVDDWPAATPVLYRPPTIESHLDIWKPMSIGYEAKKEELATVTITLTERNLLLGGLPGSGKSVAMSHLLAKVALDPRVHIWLIDWKTVEFIEWEDCAESVAETVPDAIKLCYALREIMVNNYKVLRRHRLKKINPSLGLPLHCLFIDELAPYTDGMDSKLNKEFTGLMVDLVGRGRAAGIMSVVATQKPDATTVPTKLRDLFAYKWAMRCMTPEASDTILGRGWAARGYSAVDISDVQPGVGYLFSERKMPVKLRGFYHDDYEIRSLAERAKQGRKG